MSKEVLVKFRKVTWMHLGVGLPSANAFVWDISSGDAKCADRGVGGGETGITRELEYPLRIDGDFFVERYIYGKLFMKIRSVKIRELLETDKQKTPSTIYNLVGGGNKIPNYINVNVCCRSPVDTAFFYVHRYDH